MNLLGTCTFSITIVWASKDYQKGLFGMASNGLKNATKGIESNVEMI